MQQSAGAVESVGSSPRVRGKRAGDGEDAGLGGLIPACAGKTSASRSRTRSAWAHPRVCGENCGRHPVPSWNVGSSPRVRGKLLLGLGGLGVRGLIPACAGKTPSPTTGRPRLSAHPRVCGENAAVRLGQGERRGSSPRVRGKPPKGAAHHARLRLIPACAGKTCRGCTGTPAHRLIPACAGKTLNLRAMRALNAAHPRVCGENSESHWLNPPSQGSSPRVRGKLSFLKPSTKRIRLIPACAGKTHAYYRDSDKAMAHPRVCGENSLASVSA